jgi:alpha/beta hydrolase family protein DUF900
MHHARLGAATLVVRRYTGISCSRVHTPMADIAMLATLVDEPFDDKRPPAATPVSVATSHPAATTGPTPGIAIKPSPASRPAAPPGGLVKTRQQRKNPPRFGVHLGAGQQLVTKANLDTLAPDLREEVVKRRSAIASGERGILTGLALGVAVKAFIGALRRFNRGRDHGFYPTAVEEVAKAIFAAELLGRFAWDAIKKDTRDAFQSDDNLYGGSALLAELEKIQHQNGWPRIVLIGHSAGAIFVCEMLKAAAKRAALSDLKFEVVLLAPACTFRLIDDTFTLAPDRISKFRCFAMSDELEQRDRMLGNLYPRSLLYFVSGVLEKDPDEPLFGMQRFHSRTHPFDDAAFPNIKRVLDNLHQHQNAWVWSISSAGTGLNCSCRTHGGFDEEATTMESVKHILQHGG